MAAPSADFKREGEYDGSWVLDEVSALGVDLEALAAVNAESVDLTMERMGRV